jgi:hypothetical protein
MGLHKQIVTAKRASHQQPVAFSEFFALDATKQRVANTLAYAVLPDLGSTCFAR